MHPDSDKNKKLMRQFPFLSELLRLPLEPFGQPGVRIDDLDIRVERADGDLLYRQASNIGLGDYGFSFTDTGPRRGLVARRHLWHQDGPLKS